jgi:hypothetical protein
MPEFLPLTVRHTASYPGMASSKQMGSQETRHNPVLHLLTAGWVKQEGEQTIARASDRCKGKDNTELWVPGPLQGEQIRWAS